MSVKREAFQPTPEQRQLSKLCMMNMSNGVEAILENLPGSMARVEFMSLATRDMFLLLYEYNCRVVEEHTGQPHDEPEMFIENLKGQLEHHMKRKAEGATNGV